MFRNIIMDGNENIPTDFFKGIKISLKNVLKHPDINLPKITNAVIQCNKIVINVLHPAYERMELLGDELALKEYVLQCVYDALSECFIYKQTGDAKINPNIFREVKDRFLRLRAQQAN